MTKYSSTYSTSGTTVCVCGHTCVFQYPSSLLHRLEVATADKHLRLYPKRIILVRHGEVSHSCVVVIIQLHLHLCTHARTHTHKRTRTHTRTRTRTRTRTHTHTHTCTHTHTTLSESTLTLRMQSANILMHRIYTCSAMRQYIGMGVFMCVSSEAKRAFGVNPFLLSSNNCGGPHLSTYITRREDGRGGASSPSFEKGCQS